jgi:hypothetical protein
LIGSDSLHLITPRAPREEENNTEEIFRTMDGMKLTAANNIPSLQSNAMTKLTPASANEIKMIS